MFDFMFGGKKKIELIRELLEQRMRDIGFDDMESRLKIKEMGTVQLMGTPEAALVTIIETVVKLQKKGLLIRQILEAIEDHRKSLGQNLYEYMEILKMASGSEAGWAISRYCFYRLNIEAPGRINEEQFENAFMLAAQELMKRS